MQLLVKAGEFCKTLLPTLSLGAVRCYYIYVNYLKGNQLLDSTFTRNVVQIASFETKPNKLDLMRREGGKVE